MVEFAVDGGEDNAAGGAAESGVTSVEAIHGVKGVGSRETFFEVGFAVAVFVVSGKNALGSEEGFPDVIESVGIEVDGGSRSREAQCEEREQAVEN